MKAGAHASRNTLCTRALWAVCALLVGIACTTAFFLVGPGVAWVRGAGADVALSGGSAVSGGAADGPAELAAPEGVADASEGPAASGGASAADVAAAANGEAATSESAGATGEGIAAQATFGDPASDAAAYANAVASRSILASWNAESKAYAQITSFVEDACDADGDGYIPPDGRVATFDMDGTFICEKAPIYIDQVFTCWHVLDDPAYDASYDLRAAVESIYDEVRAGIVPKSVNLNTVLAQSYAGRSPDELMDDVLRFAGSAEAAGFSGMTYAQSFYVPMLEVIEYLRANGFDVYVVTACERSVSRALAVAYAGFEPEQVVGTDLAIKASGQAGEDGATYTFEQDDELVIAGPHVVEAARTNKVIAIENEIGRRPVLAFGNSSGDFAMLNYAAANPDYRGLGFLVLADDMQREYGDEQEAAAMRDEAAQAGWTCISMRDDWSTIYGEGVSRNP